MNKKDKQSKTKRRKSSKPKSVVLKTAEELFNLPKRTQHIYTSVLNLVSRVRDGTHSRTRAMRELGLTRRQVDRFASGAFRKLENGRYGAKAYDRLLRVVMVVSNDGLREVATRDSRQASKAGKHSAAVHRYLQTGDDSILKRFRGNQITDATRKKILLLTDLEELDELGAAGVLSFESLYARNF